MKHVDEYCFVSPVVIMVKNDKSVKKALNSRKLKDSCIKVLPHEHERIVEPNFGGDQKRSNKRTNDIENRRRLRIWTNEVIGRNKQTMRIRYNRRELHRVLPI